MYIEVLRIVNANENLGEWRDRSSPLRDLKYSDWVYSPSLQPKIWACDEKEGLDDLCIESVPAAFIRLLYMYHL